MNQTTTELPEYNMTGQDYNDRSHFRYDGPIIDIHSHVMVTRPDDSKKGPPPGEGPGASTDQAAKMIEVAEDFQIEKTYTMCYPDDIPMLKERLGEKLGFNGMINKKSIDAPDDEALALLDTFLEHGAEIIKFWSAPRGRERGLFVDAPWRVESAKRAQAAGIKVMMVHVADPDTWFETVYADEALYGTKTEQYVGLRKMLELFPDLKWIGAHMGGDPEHPDHLEELLETYPHFYLDTSATKWQVREVSKRREAIRKLICRYPDRFLWGSDLVTRHWLDREHYASRYWCQRTLWESDWHGPSPIRDPDHPEDDPSPTPVLHGLALPMDVLEKVCYRNAQDLMGLA
ncbi:MAG: amidohydrolase family protein [Gemmataceae bacterium]